MAGYFRRLAEQTLRPAPLVHSAATLPYSPAPEPLPDEPETLSPPTPARSGHDEESTIRSKGRQPGPRLGSPSEYAHSPRPVEMKASGNVLATDEGASLFPPQPEQGPLLPTCAEPPRAAPAAGSHLPPFHAAQTTNLRMTAAAKPEYRKPEHGRISGKSSRRESAVRPGKAPTRQTPIGSTPAPRPPSRSEIATRSSNMDAAPDVHIHISRIELTAVPPPTAPRRESVPTRKPMSLDEYLQRRRPKDGTRSP